jgi:hypothetical protein
MLAQITFQQEGDQTQPQDAEKKENKERK